MMRRPTANGRESGCRLRRNGKKPLAAGKRRYAWGEEFVSGYANIDGAEDGFRYLAPGSFERTQSLRVYDMTGNVGEWVADVYGENFIEPHRTRDPKGAGSGRAANHSRWFLARNEAKCALIQALPGEAVAA